MNRVGGLRVAALVFVASIVLSACARAAGAPSGPSQQDLAAATQQAASRTATSMSQVAPGQRRGGLSIGSRSPAFANQRAPPTARTAAHPPPSPRPPGRPPPRSPASPWTSPPRAFSTASSACSA